jgi:pyrroline-5-carboxylate reductase
MSFILTIPPCPIEHAVLTENSTGHIGQALLTGLLAATSNQQDRSAGKITRFIATTRRETTATMLGQKYNEEIDRVIIYTSENNLLAIRESGTVILACRPGDLDGILNTDGIRLELSKKLVISVLQTRTAQEIVDALNDRGCR